MNAPRWFQRWGLKAVAVLVAVPCSARATLQIPLRRPQASRLGQEPDYLLLPAQSRPSMGSEDGAVSWDGARTASMPRQLVLSFIGGPAGPSDAPCWKGYRLEVRLEAHRVVVTLHSIHSPPRPEPVA